VIVVIYREAVEINYFLIYFIDKLRGALSGLRWYVQISIGNEFWGPLNQEKGEPSAGY
jgi:hypothetical protein